MRSVSIPEELYAGLELLATQSFSSVDELLARMILKSLPDHCKPANRAPASTEALVPAPAKPDHELIETVAEVHAANTPMQPDIGIAEPLAAAEPRATAEVSVAAQSAPVAANDPDPIPVDHEVEYQPRPEQNYPDPDGIPLNPEEVAQALDDPPLDPEGVLDIPLTPGFSASVPVRVDTAEAADTAEVAPQTPSPAGDVSGDTPIRRILLPNCDAHEGQEVRSLTWDGKYFDIESPSELLEIPIERICQKFSSGVEQDIAALSERLNLRVRREPPGNPALHRCSRSGLSFHKLNLAGAAYKLWKAAQLLDVPVHMELTSPTKGKAIAFFKGIVEDPERGSRALRAEKSEVSSYENDVGDVQTEAQTLTARDEVPAEVSPIGDVSAIVSVLWDGSQIEGSFTHSRLAMIAIERLAGVINPTGRMDLAAISGRIDWEIRPGLTKDPEWVSFKSLDIHIRRPSQDEELAIALRAAKSAGVEFMAEVKGANGESRDVYYDPTEKHPSAREILPEIMAIEPGVCACVEYKDGSGRRRNLYFATGRDDVAEGFECVNGGMPIFNALEGALLGEELTVDIAGIQTAVKIVSIDKPESALRG